MQGSRLIGVIAMLVFSSCTMILSTNVPGKTENTLPKEWLGRYKIVSAAYFPSKKDTTDQDKEYLTVEENRITWETREGIKTFSLTDSLRYSVIYGQSRYLSILMPQGLYAVFKVVKKGNVLELYSLAAEDEPKKSELNKYFSNVEKLKDGEDTYYKVTIIEKKLDAYFKSSIPSKEIKKLVPVK